MKKPDISPMYVLTLLFALLLTGIYGFRNYAHEPVQCEFANVQEPVALRSTLSDDRININTASAEELSTLPGIGEVLARRIVTYRKVHGPFQSMDALLHVEGIGKGKLEAIIDHITTGGK